LSDEENGLNRAKNLNNSHSSSSSCSLIPGISLPLQNANPKILLLCGPSGVGKTLYCMQFLREGLRKGDRCIFATTNLSKMQFSSLFSNMYSSSLLEAMEFINPYDNISSSSYRNDKALSGIKLVRSMTSGLIRSLENSETKERKGVISSQKKKKTNYDSKPMRLVVDSLTHICLLLGENKLMQFAIDLTRLLKNFNITAILTLTTSSIDQSLVSNLGSIMDGIIEMRLKENSHGLAIRSIRLRHIKGLYYEPKWTSFRISNDGNMIFRNEQYSSPRPFAEITCTLCAKPIIGTPLIKSDFVFDTKECMEIYQRLENAYGSKISDTGLPSQAFDASFFYIDMVGLSDPTLSVKTQVQKIELLNELIYSCDAFRIGSTGKKIILPSGDGMAIGFLSKPEIPLELSIQLHHKLRAHNQEKSPQDAVGVRIGLSSGSVFTVTDLNNVQNIWGPGIILARRVMDAGDDGHILIAEKLAEDLISLKDEYKQMIKLISSKYKIKHGQKIKLYSAYSDGFGNPQTPTKVLHNE
jgi:KaiC/GvpD/RAD55 family RecA-like ATPase